MALERLCVFLIIRRTSQDGTTGAVQYRFQNGAVNETITTDRLEQTQRSYTYLPFIYQGGVLNRSGDNITAGLGLAPNEISLSIATDMTQTVKDTYSTEVRPMTVDATVMLMSDTYAPKRIVSREIWVASSMAYTAEDLEIVLSSAIDAVNALAPNLSLDRQNVGTLPVSGNVRL